ncbi:MAG: tRNA (adenosine(37)-N6)-dimethylallyltransferase MiaA [Rickettsiales bacterium]|nr:tRNA (adenosine(37)-N6)-dimethylallyltransferase MiaA [Rickettsiales bacterium]OUV83192.1 MAG: tRNA (adenosine(37)-N6)-dimethylallyltransferase MiaA [Rickettsiales bacterium TMED131]|tara:strand:+ start:339 stop:1241 length:903 start_codon:yes stop_codon:yes gene_type:complete
MKKIIILGGPTASGKSKLALNIAKELDGEIINGDSMQVYKYFPILTCQPKYDDLKLVPHHLYGFVNTIKNYNAVKWLKDANKKINEVLIKDKVPIIVGGSGLYLEFMTRGISSTPKISDNIKEKANLFLLNTSKSKLLNFIMEIDKEYALKINIADKFRVLKLLEVYFETNKNISYFHNKRKKNNNFGFFKVLIKPSKDEVKKNIRRRVIEMLKEGLVQEIIDNRDKVKNCNIEKAIGFREIKSYLEQKLLFEEAIDLTIKNTKSFAKRQYTWFENRFEENLIISNTKTSLVVETFLKII